MRTIVLIDDDEAYINRLETKFLYEMGDSAHIEVITSRVYMEEYFAVLRKIDVLLIGEDMYYQDISKHDISNVFVLVKELDTEKDGGKPSNQIYKYWNAMDIFNEVKNKSMVSTEGENNTRVIVVYSAAGGDGKTFISLGLSKAMSKTKKVLYINTDTLQNFHIFLQGGEYCQSGMDKAISMRMEGIVETIQPSIGRKGFDYLLPFKNLSSAMNVSITDYIHLLESLKTANIYDYVIVDTSSEYNREKLSLIGMATYVMLVACQDFISMGSLQRLLRNLDYSDAAKFNLVCNKCSFDKTEAAELFKKLNISMRESIPALSIDMDNTDRVGEHSSFAKLAYLFL